MKIEHDQKFLENYSKLVDILCDMWKGDLSKDEIITTCKKILTIIKEFCKLYEISYNDLITKAIDNKVNLWVDTVFIFRAKDNTELEIYLHRLISVITIMLVKLNINIKDVK